MYLKQPKMASNNKKFVLTVNASLISSAMVLQLVSILLIKRTEFLRTEEVKQINPLTTSVPHHTDTCQLICIANQLNGFYMIGNIGR